MNDTDTTANNPFAWMQDVLGDELPPAPYPGLRPFEAEESIIFFGREQHINDVLDRIAHANFVAVVGPSGCGKSSLVKAGVIPALERGRHFEAGTHWRIADMRPGTAPMWNLSKSLHLTISSARLLTSSLRITTWSLSQRTPRLMWRRTSSQVCKIAESLSAIDSVG